MAREAASGHACGECPVLVRGANDSVDLRRRDFEIGPETLVRLTEERALRESDGLPTPSRQASRC